MSKPRIIDTKTGLYTAENIEDFRRGSENYISKQGVDKYLKEVYSSLLEKQRSGDCEDRKRALWAYHFLKEDIRVDKPLIVPESLIEKPNIPKK